MQTSKRILTALLSFGVLTITGQTALLAQTNTTATNTPPAGAASTNTAMTTTSAPASDNGMAFQKGEIYLSPYATYVDQTGKKWGAGVAGTYFITDKIGVGAATYWTETGGTFFDNLAAEGYYRVPLERIAPYAMVSIGKQFDRSYWFETFGGGLDFRAFKRFNAFADVQYRIANSDNFKNGALLRIGLRFKIK